MTDESWKPRFADMEFDVFEATTWEKLVSEGMARDDATTEMLRRRELAATNPTCNYCGSLGWTVRNYGRITHKEACPHRTDPWHQGDPEARGRRVVARFYNEDGIEMPPLFHDDEHGLLCAWNYLLLVAPQTVTYEDALRKIGTPAHVPKGFDPTEWWQHTACKRAQQAREALGINAEELTRSTWEEALDDHLPSAAYRRAINSTEVKAAINEWADLPPEQRKTGKLITMLESAGASAGPTVSDTSSRA